MPISTRTSILGLNWKLGSCVTLKHLEVTERKTFSSELPNTQGEGGVYILFLCVM